VPGESGTATGTIARRLPGDRVEEALQQRADLQGELARGHAEQPSRRSLVRTLVWLAITGVSLYLVAPTLLDTARLVAAVLHRRRYAPHAEAGVG